MSDKRLESGVKFLVGFGLFWVVIGGLVAAGVGIRDIGQGEMVYGLGSLGIGAAILSLSAWFTKRELL